jgi:hypothetical protein
MNLLGKIFVVLIFVLSIFFMAMALMVYATHKNWKEEITRTAAQATAGQTVGWQARYEQLKKQNEDLKGQNEALEKEVTGEKVARAEALAKLQTALSLRTQELEAKEKELTEKSTALASSTTALEKQTENANIATAQVQKLTQDIKNQIARADDLFKKSLELTDQLSQANVQMPALKERSDQLAEMLAKARLLLAQTGATLEDPIDRRPPPIDATVEAVTREGLVEIAAGRHDGIRTGHELNIARGNNFIGRIKISYVTEDRAVGTVLPEYTDQQIRRGDRATTKLDSARAARTTANR